MSFQHYCKSHSGFMTLWITIFKYMYMDIWAIEFNSNLIKTSQCNMNINCINENWVFTLIYKNL